MIDFLNSKKIFYASITIIATILVCVALYMEGTGGGGDSTFHYQYSKFALQHPENFFDHWAKPVFTMLAFPFTFMGFKGIMIFNILMSLIACIYTYKTLQTFNTKNSQWIAIILYSITLYVTVTLSGLTEPLSAAMLMLSIYLIVKNKNILGVSIISFLPFVRSEGLIILGVFFIYLFLSKKIKFIPFLAIGHAIMSVIGSFYYHDLLWVFNKIPYAHLGSVYGKGTWYHFLEQLFFQMGFVEYSLFILGGIFMINFLFKNNAKTHFFNEKLWLIYGCFMAFFIAHSCFWALGIFNSMGLSRVFVFVMPLMAMIVLDGFNYIELLTLKLNIKLANFTKYTIILLLLIFPFLNSPASYKIPENFELESTQKVVKNSVIPYLKMYHPNKTVIISDVGISFFLNIDPFDKKSCKMYYDISDFNLIDSNQVIIWDNWFSPVEYATPFEKLAKCNTLKMDTTFNYTDKKGREVQYAVFSKK
jgi:hypothetical protein